MNIFNNRKQKNNYKIIRTNKGRVIKFNIIFNIWVSLREQDFKYNFFNVVNRIQFYLFLLLFSIILPILAGPYSVLTYLTYIIFIVIESVDNRIVYSNDSLESISDDIDEIIFYTHKTNNTEMIFGKNGEAISGTQLERVKKLERITENDN